MLINLSMLTCKNAGSADSVRNFAHCTDWRQLQTFMLAHTCRFLAWMLPRGLEESGMVERWWNPNRIICYIYLHSKHLVRSLLWTAPLVPAPLCSWSLASREICLLQCHFSEEKHTRFNLLKPTGYMMHQQFNIQQLYALPTLYLCVLYLSENKQRIVSLTA